MFIRIGNSIFDKGSVIGIGHNEDNVNVYPKLFVIVNNGKHIQEIVLCYNDYHRGRMMDDYREAIKEFGLEEKEIKDEEYV